MPFFLLVPAMVAAPPALSPEAAVAALLDDWHLAAAQAEEERYFGHMAEGSVFLGTDATERWDKAAFRAYAHPHFAKGRAWSFRAVRRSVSVAGDMAWFDEDLDTPSMGPCRGTGVLARQGGVWRILQYNLTVPIPNALMGQVSGAIAAHLKGAKAPSRP